MGSYQQKCSKGLILFIDPVRAWIGTAPFKVVEELLLGRKQTYMRHNSQR
jgi:hypothetical protein